jgi:hypothetical protein
MERIVGLREIKYELRECRDELYSLTDVNGLLVILK